MDSKTGKALSGYDHIRQSLRDILSTPLGSRVMRRNYGSRIWELVDAPLNGATIIQIYGATIEAVLAWEPRIIPVRVSVKLGKPGQVFVTLEAIVQDDGKTVTFDGIQIIK